MTSVQAMRIGKVTQLRRFQFLLWLLLALIWNNVAHAAADDRANFPPIYTVSPKGVNIQTGRYLISNTEFSIGPLSFSRFKGGPVSYMNLDRGLDAFAGAFGGWFHNHALAARQGNRSGAPYIYVYIGGQKMEFAVLSNPSITTYPAWNDAAQGWVLVRSGSTLIATNSNGDEYRFQFVTGMPHNQGYQYPDYAIVTIDFADGHKVDYSYNDRAQPRVIVSNRGYAIVLDYNSSGFLNNACGYNTAVTYVSTATTCAGATLKTSYTYSTSGLASVTDVSGAVTTFSYADDPPYGRIETISQPGSSAIAIQNFMGPQPGDLIPSDTRPDQVRKQITATGDVWLYRYEPYTISDLPQQPGEKRDTYSYVTYPTGAGVEAKYINGVVEHTSGPEGFIRYIYYGLTPAKIIYPEGNALAFGYDSARNIIARQQQPKPGVIADPLTEIWTYPDAFSGGGALVCQAASPKLCNKAITYTDARNNVTDYTYAPEHGGILTETAPAVNGVRAQTRYTYTQRFAWVKNASGAFVRASTPVWVLVQKSICKAGAASGAGCAVAGDEVKTAYDYGPDSGPNNLLLRGVVEDVGGLNLRTCYTYDWRGNKVSETSPRSGLGFCS